MKPLSVAALALCLLMPHEFKPCLADYNFNIGGNGDQGGNGFGGGLGADFGTSASGGSRFGEGSWQSGGGYDGLKGGSGENGGWSFWSYPGTFWFWVPAQLDGSLGGSGSWGLQRGQSYPGSLYTSSVTGGLGSSFGGLPGGQGGWIGQTSPGGYLGLGLRGRLSEQGGLGSGLGLLGGRQLGGLSGGLGGYEESGGLGGGLRLFGRRRRNSRLRRLLRRLSGRGGGSSLSGGLGGRFNGLDSLRNERRLLWGSFGSGLLGGLFGSGIGQIAGLGAQGLLGRSRLSRRLRRLSRRNRWLQAGGIYGDIGTGGRWRSVLGTGSGLGAGLLLGGLRNRGGLFSNFGGSYGSGSNGLSGWGFGGYGSRRNVNNLMQFIAGSTATDGFHNGYSSRGGRSGFGSSVGNNRNRLGAGVGGYNRGNSFGVGIEGNGVPNFGGGGGGTGGVSSRALENLRVASGGNEGSGLGGGFRSSGPLPDEGFVLLGAGVRPARLVDVSGVSPGRPAIGFGVSGQPGDSGGLSVDGLVGGYSSRNADTARSTSGITNIRDSFRGVGSGLSGRTNSAGDFSAGGNIGDISPGSANIGESGSASISNGPFATGGLSRGLSGVGGIDSGILERRSGREDFPGLTELGGSLSGTTNTNGNLLGGADFGGSPSGGANSGSADIAGGLFVPGDTNNDRSGGTGARSGTFGRRRNGGEFPGIIGLGDGLHGSRNVGGGGSTSIGGDGLFRRGNDIGDMTGNGGPSGDTSGRDLAGEDNDALLSEGRSLGGRGTAGEESRRESFPNTWLRKLYERRVRHLLKQLQRSGYRGLLGGDGNTGAGIGAGTDAGTGAVGGAGADARGGVGGHASTVFGTPSPLYVTKDTDRLVVSSDLKTLFLSIKKFFTTTTTMHVKVACHSRPPTPRSSNDMLLREPSKLPSPGRANTW
ncbi:hypothetical protein V5799_007105 [Amblyomma americanum]|uniref:Glycine-rich cell wall structural protein 1 n=1 Tax=Amblyomma americanum TaxID=6943 RepID=A0AAQ4DUH4_AMBAM